jgi:O-antigen/teichoic acid export membrane protein
MLAGCLLTAACLPAVVRVLLGPAFLPAVEIFWWLAPGVFFHALSSVVSQYHAARGMPKILIYFWSAAVLVLLAAGALLIPQFGGAGAAAAFSLASGVIFLSLLALAIQSSKAIATEARHGRQATGPLRPHIRAPQAASRH